MFSGEGAASNTLKWSRCDWQLIKLLLVFKLYADIWIMDIPSSSDKPVKQWLRNPAWLLRTHRSDAFSSHRVFTLIVMTQFEEKHNKVTFCSPSLMVFMMNSSRQRTCAKTKNTTAGLAPSNVSKNDDKIKSFQFRGLSSTTAGRRNSLFNRTFCSVWPHLDFTSSIRPTCHAAKCYFIAIANFAKSLKEHNISM